MAAPRFLLQTPLSGDMPILLDGAPVQARYAELQRVAGPHAALFAEPVPTRDADGNIVSFAWYAQGVEARPLAEVHATQRGGPEGMLRSALAALMPRVLGDGPDAVLLGAALTLRDMRSIIVVDGRPVLAGWGVVPPDDSRDTRTRIAAGLGLFLPAAASTGSNPAGAERIARAPAPRAAMPVPQPGGRAQTGPRRLWLIPAGLAVAVIFLAIGFWLGWHILAEAAAKRTLTATLLDRDQLRVTLEEQRRTNEALTQEVEQARLLLEGNVCRATPLATPPGRAPAAQDLPARPDAQPAAPATPAR